MASRRFIASAATTAAAMMRMRGDGLCGWSMRMLDGAINNDDVANGASACGMAAASSFPSFESCVTPTEGELAYAVAGWDKGRGGVGRYVVLLTVVRDLQSVLDEL